MVHAVARPAWLAVGLGLSACDGPLSTLKPAGRDAERIAQLFWWMAGGAVVIWLFVMGLAIYAMGVRDQSEKRVQVRLFIIGGGTLLPVVVLAGLLIYGLSMMPSLLHQGDPKGPKIRVIGEQWWWRVRYELPDGTSFELANEIRLPVGRRLPVWLETRDVIHSFWVPSIGGKVDMIPGRVNRTALEATRTGTFWGACAEYCGSSHARMLFRVAVVEGREFERWLAEQASPANPPTDPSAQRGAFSFRTLGCGACHTIRGTAANGSLGPDLTHVGGRLSLGAGILENEVSSFGTWLVRLREVKPGVHMPSFDMLADGEVKDLAHYLEGLE